MLVCANPTAAGLVAKHARHPCNFWATSCPLKHVLNVLAAAPVLDKVWRNEEIVWMEGKARPRIDRTCSLFPGGHLKQSFGMLTRRAQLNTHRRSDKFKVQ